MRMICGNTVKKGRSWHQKHVVSPDTPMQIGALNVGGLQKAAKRRRIIDLDLDLVALTETHVQCHLEHSESNQYPEYFSFWSHNASENHFSGVGLLAMKSTFWAAKQIRWPTDHPCFRFFKDSRLLAVQLWFGRGGTSLTVYVAYGVSGGGWDRSKQNYFHKLMSAVRHDGRSRGPIPHILCGFSISKFRTLIAYVDIFKNGSGAMPEILLH